MGIGVAAVEAAGGEGRMPALAAGRREIRCRGCGYGAIVTHPLWGCPMCGGGDWRLVQDGNDDDSARRQP
jgi:rubrerythrin